MILKYRTNNVYLTNMTQLIELWETFLLQLDAGEDDNPFYPPGSEHNTSAESAPEGPTETASSTAEEA